MAAASMGVALRTLMGDGAVSISGWWLITAISSSDLPPFADEICFILTVEMVLTQVPFSTILGVPICYSS
jgi:hypothetical protein